MSTMQTQPAAKFDRSNRVPLPADRSSIIAKYEKLIRTTARRLCRRGGAPRAFNEQDVAQEVVIAILTRSGGSFSFTGRLDAWIINTTRSVFSNMVQKYAIECRHIDRMKAMAASDLPGNRLFCRESAMPEDAEREPNQLPAPIADALRQLPECQRLALEALYLDPTEPVLKDAAEMLELSRGSVCNAKYSALKKLRNRFAAEAGAA